MEFKDGTRISNGYSMITVQGGADKAPGVGTVIRDVSDRRQRE